MKLHKLQEVPLDNEEIVFRIKVGPKLNAVLIFGALALFPVVVQIGKFAGYWAKFPTGLQIALFIGFGLFGWMAWARYRAARQPTSWLLRCNPHGILVKFRSYLNWRIPEPHPIAVEIEWSEIESVNSRVEAQTSRGMDGKTSTSKVRYIDLALKQGACPDLADALATERRYRPGKAIWMHYPVLLLDDSVLQIEWTEADHSLEDAVKILGQFTQTTATQRTRKDFSHFSGLTNEQKAENFRELVARGEDLQAAEYARLAFGCNLTEAMKMVEKAKSFEKASP